jgi:hypothetical protein
LEGGKRFLEDLQDCDFSSPSARDLRLAQEEVVAKKSEELRVQKQGHFFALTTWLLGFWLAAGATAFITTNPLRMLAAMQVHDSQVSTNLGTARNRAYGCAS